MKSVLIAFERYGRTRDEWQRAGFNAWSADLVPASGKHITGDCYTWPINEFDIVIAHPPCTYLTRANCGGGPGWREKEALQSIQIFNWLLNSNVKYMCIENPPMMPQASKLLPISNQRISASHFGVPEFKIFHLWLKNLPPLISQYYVLPKLRVQDTSSQNHYFRNKFPIEITHAMINQWRALL